MNREFTRGEYIDRGENNSPTAYIEVLAQTKEQAQKREETQFIFNSTPTITPEDFTPKQSRRRVVQATPESTWRKYPAGSWKTVEPSGTVNVLRSRKRATNDHDALALGCLIHLDYQSELRNTHPLEYHSILVPPASKELIIRIPKRAQLAGGVETVSHSFYLAKHDHRGQLRVLNSSAAQGFYVTTPNFTGRTREMKDYAMNIAESYFNQYGKRRIIQSDLGFKIDDLLRN